MTVRQQWGRLISLMLAQFRRLDLVEEALADAVEAAARHWPSRGVPDNPTAWLLTAARRRVLDQIRAEATARHRAPLPVSADDQRQRSTQLVADPSGRSSDDRPRVGTSCSHQPLLMVVGGTYAFEISTSQIS